MLRFSTVLASRATTIHISMLKHVALILMHVVDIKNFARAKHCIVTPLLPQPDRCGSKSSTVGSSDCGIKERNLIPFLDIAYQGFGDSMEQDAYAIRALDQAGLNFIVSNSFSKIFSLYGERVGGLTFVCDDAEAAKCTFGQLKSNGTSYLL